MSREPVLKSRTTSITEFHIRAGKVYLSPIIDCFDGLVISWTIGTRPDADLVNTMLDAAVETIADSEARPIVHSDRGGHYRWPGWNVSTQRSSFARCHERRARKTMPHVKASSDA
ncbi:Integrase, catalytic region [Sulfitobacter indolifex HEL-45]|uniref:Integrase, catalytic region n=1 Tax=Sulfitobacter indolifex HEL-45 TaxID=391624 RepID=A0ABM9X0R8_9RHOB|nr:Integrase, catalytic region [Sulfitobacter indolifex HEL-45]